mgnify:FL=1
MSQSGSGYSVVVLFAVVDTDVVAGVVIASVVVEELVVDMVVLVVEDVVDIVVDVVGVSGLQQKSDAPWQSSPVRVTGSHNPTESQNFLSAPH